MTRREHADRSVEYKRQCPKCNKDIVYKSRYGYDYAMNKNTNCLRCNHLGKKQSPEAIKKTADWHRGKPAPNRGIPASEETKRKCRIAAINQHRMNGIDFPAVDKGSKECFQWLNEHCDLNIQYPNVEIKDLGYFLDGYDRIANAAFEYDSSYHLEPDVKVKDLLKQKQIVQYFENIGRPLNHFYRIDATGVGSIEIKDVLTQTER